jgi:hypothetical protein
MDTFVDKIAHYIKNEAVSLEDWVIILPSERAKHYMQKALFEAYSAPIFSPKILTIQQWVKSHATTSVLSKTRLLFHLFEAHKKITEAKDDASFDEFLAWGNILLADFDEMERYMIDASYLFRNLKDIKDIENWSFGEDAKISDRQKKFMEFWEKLPAYYAEFQYSLSTINASTLGKVYRKLAEEIDLAFKNNKNAHFLFAGFNAMSLSEKKIIKQLIQLGRGHFIIDADAFYLNDDHHEAGTFLRNLTNYLGVKKPSFVGNNLQNQSKYIEVISCAQLTGQVKVAATFLADFSKEKMDKTMVLLADENLIVPLLNNLPKKVGEANITLGLPIKNSAVRTWIDLLFKVQETILKYQHTNCYHKDLIAFWNHPFMLAIMNKEEEKIIQTKEFNIRRNNTIFQSLKSIQISARFDELLQLIYTPWNANWKLALATIRRMNTLLFATMEKDFLVEKALIQAFDASIVDFENCIDSNFPQMSIRTFKTLFNNEWTKENVAFYGNPMTGLQIMGLLETRLLDFETIIVVGMNEGNMPPTNPIQTLIPMDLRNHLELPMPRDKQGLFAHHFYRLLHACTEMYITYANTSEGVNANEPSRYLLQLELELAAKNDNITLVKKDYSLHAVKQNTETKKINKTNELVLRLDHYLAQGISASALKTFFACPLDFYYKYILKFGEEKKVDEEVESSQLGTFVHEVLEDLYQPYINDFKQEGLKKPKILVDDIERMEKDFPLLMRKKFSAFFNDNPEAFSKGKNYLSFTIANELTKRFFQFEKDRLLKLNNQGIAILALEEEINLTLTIPIFGVEKEVKLKGVIDRVDQIGEDIYILDYKTGKVTRDDVGKSYKNSRFDKLEYLVHSSKNDKHFFQLMLYCFLFYKKHHRIPKSSAIISLVTIKDSPFHIHTDVLAIHEMVELFPQVLQHLIEEIYDPSVDFIHTEDHISYCKFCN